MTSKPLYQVTVGASGRVIMGDHTAAIEQLPVINSGARPLTVHIKISDTTRFTQMYPAAPWVKWVRPDVITLRPGQSVWVRVKIVPPPGQASAGTHAFNLTAQAAPAGHTHGAMGGTIGIGSGGTIKVVRPGHATAVSLAPAPRAPVLPARPAGFPYVAAAGLGAILVCLAVAAALIFRHRHPVGGHR